MNRCLLLWLVVGLVGCGSDTPHSQPSIVVKTSTPVIPSHQQEDTTEMPTIKTTAKEIVEEFNNNEIVAEMKYKGKFAQVNGIISGIGLDSFGDPFIDLDTGKGRMTRLHCRVVESDKSKAAEAKKGAAATVVGQATGSVLGVNLDKCRVVSIE
jgi:hypothetical protein